MQHARKIGHLINKKLKEIEGKYYVIGDARGMGAMAAIELVRDRKTKEPAKQETSEIIKFCVENGLVIMKAGAYDNVVRLLVPLIITEDLLTMGLSILEKAVKTVNKRYASKKRS